LKLITGKEGEMWAEKMFTAPGWGGKDGNPSWAGVTQGEAIEGIRGGRCYLDDPIDISSQSSSVFRSNAVEWYNHSLRPRLNRGAHVTVIGSPWHPDDLYAELVRRGIQTHIFPMKKVTCPPLWTDRPNVHWHGEEYDMLWPENWKDEDTPKLMNDVGGPVAFDQRYMCNPQAIMGRRFKPEWFTFWDKMPDLEDCVIEFGLDPAISKSEISDNTSLCIIAFDKGTNKIYVLENPAGHWDFNETVTHLKNYAKQYNPTRITIEKAAYQQALVDYLMGNTTLPVIGQPAIGDKVSRIDTLAVSIQNGRIIFGKDQHELIQELLYFPDGSHDDRADSLEVAVRHILRGESWGAPMDLSEVLPDRMSGDGGQPRPRFLPSNRERFPNR
jgi:predicted phage terminase large subunit-like protein